MGGAPVDASNAAARALALALGQLEAPLRPTEIGTPWTIDAPGYFTDNDHRDHLHVGFDDALTVPVATGASAPSEVTIVPVRKRAASPAEPRFDAGTRPGAGAGGGSDPRFEVAK